MTGEVCGEDCEICALTPEECTSGLRQPDVGNECAALGENRKQRHRRKAIEFYVGSAFKEEYTWYSTPRQYAIASIFFIWARGYNSNLLIAYNWLAKV